MAEPRPAKGWKGFGQVMSASDSTIQTRWATSHTRGLAALAAAVTAWGIGWPVNRAILYHLPPLTTVAVRSAIAAAALFAIAGSQRRLTLPDRQDVPVLLSISLLHMTGYAILTSIGLLFVPVGRSIVLAYTMPLWITPGAALFLGERLTARRAVGVILGLGGLAVLFNPFGFDWHNRQGLIGNGVLLLAALLWAGSILHIRAHRWKAAPFDLIPWEMALATLLLAVMALAIDGWPHIPWTGNLVLLMLYSALPGTALAFWAAAVASQNLPAVTTSLGLLAAPVIGIIASALTLGERPTPTLITAIAMIIGGIVLGTIATGAARARLK
ncbi:MAG TPA: DMT family transporter [Stellaceae bacterium]|nr:DMT family transporter [Stellaceae bacterium]